MLEEKANLIAIQPVVSYPREARVGKTYLMTIDLRVSETTFSWPYEEEELPVYCFVDASSLFDSEPLGDATIILHRFGGTYGPAEFLLTTTDNPIQNQIRITLTSSYGKPLKVITLDDVRVIQKEVSADKSKKVTKTKSTLIPMPAPKFDKPTTVLPSTKGLPGTRVPIHLKTSRITLAIAQLLGPLPDAKQKVVMNDRETLAWKSLEDMRARLEKAYAILERLGESSPKPDMVVFSEYAFPVLQALPSLQRLATQYDFVIVGGTDSILQPNSSMILNQSPILIPGREQPLWVTKRVVSQWEEGLVDSPGDIEQPLLTWSANGAEYWISTQISLDFSLSSEEFRTGGGLIIVPMCSPDLMSFLGWADALLRLEGGAATVLCNCVGGGAKGQSAVVAVNPGGKPFQAALELSPTKEQVAVFEVDLQHLVPPKKTSATAKFPLGRRWVYDLEPMLEGHQLRDEGLPEQATKRGVINPVIFSAVLGKTMRIAFLNVLNYADVEKNVQGQDYEALAILGKEDLVITHLAQDRYDMIFDITRAINWVGIRGELVTMQDMNEIDEGSFPHFRVDTYFKIMGVAVSEIDRGVFTGPSLKFPNFEEIEKLFRLGQEWEDSNVADDERTRFTRNRWILDVTSPKDTNALMTIGLQHTRSEVKAHLLNKFEKRMLSKLIANDQVTSIFRGSSPGLGIDYILRLSCDVSSISQLQDELHDVAQNERLLIDTTTYIVHKKLSDLSLSKAILVTRISRDKGFRDRRVLPYLSNDESVRLSYQSEKEQLEFIDLFRPADEALDKIKHIGLESEDRHILLRRLTRGLFNQDFDSLREVHDQLQTRSERRLRTFIKDRIDEEEFRQLKAREGIPSQKDKSQLNYSERIKLLFRYLEEASSNEIIVTTLLRDELDNESFQQIKARLGIASQKTKTELTSQEKEAIFNQYLEESERLASVKGLMDTNKVRNAMVHDDTGRITLRDFVDTIVRYCGFLYAWEQ